MSGYYYPTSSAEEEYHLAQAYRTHAVPQQPLPSYEPHLFSYGQQPLAEQTEYYQSPPQYPPMDLRPYQPSSEPVPWTQGQIPSNVDSYSHEVAAPFPQYTEAFDYGTEPAVAGSSQAPAAYLSPNLASRGRLSRAGSFMSNTSSVQSKSDMSRSGSPNAGEMAKWGFKNMDGSWSCGFPGCTSRSTFTRGCDLRKHYKRHSKSLFCRHDGCPQATEGGFSSKKDRARHEAKHNPSIVCEWDGCERLFSRQDNMVSGEHG
ncbi:hypothetical protein M409DRAFT_19388 [Zasmidium cellare ATCC 36951]|uniref:C2H2-type domain-containing protein n=1 Tax=Zasmidium cellare ATCC 36951 TaxID=1080233 RepID=A0A6A6CWJ9_ZASCE|nr:uncharacterized protein M409DRAFT_19388 [Zasmidium cellare ATCC 36951]KAF2170570.1 hypothetical protein M409DRAFT_19388 [Zasmidium cellare ATCC 36951]